MLKQHPSHAHECHGLDISKEVTADCRVKLNVKVSKEEVQQAYKKAVKEVSRHVTIPGFRKGKAPQKILETQYKDHIDREWKKQIVDDTLHHAISHVDEKPLAGRVEKADLKDFSKEGADLHIEYEMEPLSPEVVDLEGFVPKEEAQEEITDEDVEKTVDRLRHYHAQWKDITDRSVQDGDWVALEIDCLDEPKIRMCSDTQFHIKRGEVAGWIYDLVIGKNSGDVVEGRSVQDPTEDIEEKIEFKPAMYRLTIQKIKEPQLPEIDDQLSQKMGAQTKDELMHKIRENLENEKKLFITLQRREQLSQFLCQKYPIELPKSLLEYEKKVFLQNRIEGFLTRGITQDWIKEHINSILEEINKTASTRLRLIYILRKEAEKLGVKVLVSDLQKEMLYERYVRPSEERIIHPDMKDEEKEGRLYFTLLTEKTLDKIMESR